MPRNRDFSLKRREFNEEDIKKYEDGRNPSKCDWGYEISTDIWICRGNCLPCFRVDPKNCSYIDPDGKIKEIKRYFGNDNIDVVIEMKDNKGE